MCLMFHLYFVTHRQFETVIPIEDSVITEMTVTLRDWGTMWKQLFVVGRNEGDLFHRLWHVMNEILDLRQQVLVGHLTNDCMNNIKQHITARLDWGNEQLGLDLVPRKEFNLVDPDKISVTELYQLMEQRHRKKEIPVQASMHHLFVQVKSLMNANLGEEMEVFFFIYDCRENRPISERFLVRLNKQGVPHSLEKMESQCTLFIDLGSNDLRKDVFVVAHLIRIGRMVAGEKKNVCNTQYRRPYGCAVISIADLLTAESKDDHLLKVYSCNAESEWCQIHDNIIRKISSRYSPVGSNTGLAVTLQLLHGDLEQIHKDCMHLFTHSISITKRLGFSEIIMPGETRNDLYITLERGEFEKGGKSVARNVEISVHLVEADGEIPKNLIFAGTGDLGVDQHQSFVLYHSNSPRWAEQIKLPIPVDIFRGLHLRFEFRHCSTKEKGEKKLFGFSFIPLMQDGGCTLPDGMHELIVHKDTLRYLKLPFSKANLSGNNQAARSTKESFWITSFLCSTKLTQNGDMLNLLNWRTHPEKISDSLSKLKDLDGTEVVKVDFELLSVTWIFFPIQVHVINLLHDTKFHHFKLVMDNYIENHFAGALSYRDLIKFMKWYVSRIIDAEHHEQIQQVLKASEYVFKYIVQSRQLYAVATCGQSEEEFRCSIYELFKSVHLFLSHESKGVNPITHTQAVFLRSFPTVCCELLKIFTVEEVAVLARDTIGSLPNMAHTDCPLQTVKLQCIAKTVESPLYTNTESRCVLLPVVLHHLEVHMQGQRDLGMCAHILTKIYPQTPRTAMRLQYQDVTGEFVACLLTLLRQLNDKDYQQLLTRLPSKDELTNFLLQLFTIFQILIRPDMFPRDWTVMRLVTNNVIITTLLYLSDTLRKNFLNEQFDFKVWESYFYLSIVFINQPCLQLETFPPSKRKKVLEKYVFSSLRIVQNTSLSASFWVLFYINVDEHKLNFIPGMIGPFLEVTLVPQPDLRNVMIPIFHDMLECEQRRSGNFKQVEAKLIDKLDSLMSDGKGDETYKELFNSIIPLFGPYPSLLKKIERETWRESGASLIATNFYKTELNKEEMYIRYIHKLYDLHFKAQNYTEAAYTLLLYDELLEWTERPLREFLTYPMQSEWQRKECLHLTIIHNFDRGKCWENCIILCRELANQYEAYFDYRNLSKMRMMEASLYEKIINQQRLEPEFFRIGFYGKKFPFFLRNKEFVCRGNDYERLEAFQQRMLSEFPHAIAMQHANMPDQTIHQAEAQYLQIYTVSPVPDRQDVLQRDGVPNNIKSFYKVNHIWRFRYDRPFHKGSKDKENEFKSLWVERTTLTLAQSLPGISRWFEVEKRELVEISPLENASEVIENKNLELRTLIAQCQTRQMQNINPLTMCLNGVIDAAVNGGLARYQEAFFAKDYIANHPEDGDKINRLRDLMFEQAHILEFGLTVHEKFVPQDMRPLHKKLVDQFHVMRTSLGLQVITCLFEIYILNAHNALCMYTKYLMLALDSRPSPSTSSLSSNHSSSAHVNSSAPSSNRGG
uniref:Dedicator of cytokinesis 4b n=1 Tax=Denticeps clupeoides TaxID=299321 RepID=A0AAY4E1Y9_9TELE